jgi:Zn-dependent peptidase ImmA (M78 family)
MSVVVQNINRLNHLLALFKLSGDDLLQIINQRKKKKVSEKDIFSDEIKISLLKQVDAVFDRGLAYYVDPENPELTKDESIFFRKDSFNAQLNLAAKQIVSKYEDEKLLFSTLVKLSELDIKRVLPIYRVSDSPIKAAQFVRSKIHRAFKQGKTDKEFLKGLIISLSEFNVLIFEFVEARNKKLKANIDGFYISPNVIVIKWQKYLKREIFTLLHELGHYLLNDEDIDDTTISENLLISTSSIEQWCNDFAFHLLIGNQADLFNSLNIDDRNEYHTTIGDISRFTHLSRLSLYTRLLYTHKISQTIYNEVYNDIKVAISKNELEEKAKTDQQKLKTEAEGKPWIIPLQKPILSPMYKNTLELAYYNGFINEYEVCKKLKVKSDKLEANFI